jgi:hypothetical protein
MKVQIFSPCISNIQFQYLTVESRRLEGKKRETTVMQIVFGKVILIRRCNGLEQQKEKFGIIKAYRQGR